MSSYVIEIDYVTSYLFIHILTLLVLSDKSSRSQIIDGLVTYQKSVVNPGARIFQ